ncbi:MAG: dihydroorotate dehydrogenase, partial [Saccharopolyspora rectivirgula]
MSVAQQRNLRLVRDFPREPGVQLGDIHLRNRLVTSSSLLGYGVANAKLVPYGMSPISQFVPLERFGAVTTRTLTVEPREG